MKQNMGRLIRYFLIINKLRGRCKYVPLDDLLDYLAEKMRERGYNISISQRTLQRDFKEIDQMLSITIKHRRDKGYYIEYKDNDPDISYDRILMDFDLATAINPEIRDLGFILPEHHRPKGSDNMPLFIEAIKDCRKLIFDYILFRHDNEIIRKTVKPYFLKESLGLWYVVGLDEKNRLRTFGVDRMYNIVIAKEQFEKDLSIDPDNLYTYSYGIWNDGDLPVEHIELSFSALDGSFVKSKPFHWTQKVLVDTKDELRISLDIRITNDLVMALLSRSKSIEVISPAHLRKQIREIARNCVKRNS